MAREIEKRRGKSAASRVKSTRASATRGDTIREIKTVGWQRTKMCGNRQLMGKAT